MCPALCIFPWMKWHVDLPLSYQGPSVFLELLTWSLFPPSSPCVVWSAVRYLHTEPVQTSSCPYPVAVEDNCFQSIEIVLLAITTEMVWSKQWGCLGVVGFKHPNISVSPGGLHVKWVDKTPFWENNVRLVLTPQVRVWIFLPSKQWFCWPQCVASFCLWICRVWGGLGSGQWLWKTVWVWILAQSYARLPCTSEFMSRASTSSFVQ